MDRARKCSCTVRSCLDRVEATCQRGLHAVPTGDVSGIDVAMPAALGIAGLIVDRGSEYSFAISVTGIATPLSLEQVALRSLSAQQPELLTNGWGEERRSCLFTV